MAFKGRGSSFGFIHIVVGFQNPEAGHDGKGNTKKIATRLLLDVLGQTKPVLQ